MTEIILPPNGIITPEEASSRPRYRQGTPIRKMGHRPRGGAGTVPIPNYGFSAKDWVNRNGAPTFPSRLTGAYKEEPDYFSTVPPATTSVYWQNTTVGSTNAIFVDATFGGVLLNDNGTFPYFTSAEGPKTSTFASPNYVFPDSPCTIAWLVWVTATVSGINGYASFGGVDTAGWHREFSINYPTFKDIFINDGVTVYGTAGSDSVTLQDIPAYVIFRQTSTTASFNVIKQSGSVALSGSYSEARVPTGGLLKIFCGCGNTSVYAVWRCVGIFAWSTSTYLSDAQVLAYCNTHMF